MNETHNSDMLKRIERLETAVAEIQRILKQANLAPKPQQQTRVAVSTGAPTQKQAPPQTVHAKPAPSTLSPIAKPFELPEYMRSSEYWLNKIGIGLLLFGVAFLFKYSIDQGWLTPALRVAFGLILGTGLIVTGLRIPKSRLDFSQVLIGGGIATFYITGFAAFQLLNLINYPIAFTFMLSVTVLAFVLALKQNGALLALIGALGGLGTPFLLYTHAGSIPGLVGYTCLILAGSAAIYFFRGWRTLLWASVLGGWLIFLIGLLQIHPFHAGEALADRWTLQAGILFTWLTFWLTPIGQEYIRKMNPDYLGVAFPLHRHLHVLSISTPLMALGLSKSIWILSNPSWGWITLCGAIVYGFASWGLAKVDFVKHLPYTHALVGLMLLTYAFYLVLEGNSLFVVLAAEAAVLRLVAHRLSDYRIAINSHILFFIIGLWYLARILVDGHAQGTAILNRQALTDLLVIGIAGAIAIQAKLTTEKWIYLTSLHLALLAWFVRELISLPSGQAYITIAWGAYAITLLIIGLRINRAGIQSVAMGTLLIIVGKLFLVDLAELETIWRVLLFLGFGGIFLLLSYYFRTLWRSHST